MSREKNSLHGRLMKMILMDGSEPLCIQLTESSFRSFEMAESSSRIAFPEMP